MDDYPTLDVVEEADEICNFINTDDQTDDTNYKSDNVNNFDN